MFIKELEIHNFKSFGKRVKIPFFDDFTAVSGARSLTFTSSSPKRALLLKATTSCSKVILRALLR